MKRLENKKIIITGASRGIGAEIAKQCAKEGAKVAIIYLSNHDKALDIFNVLEGSGHLVIQADIGDEVSVKKMIDLVLKEWNGIDGLVNNAGVVRNNILLRMTVEDFDDVIRTNLRGTFLCTKAVSKEMLKIKSGSIVHMASVAGQIGLKGKANYSASKAGIEAFSRSVASELGSRNIRSNCVSPGLIKTDMSDALIQKAKDEMLENIPLGRIGTVEDIAKAVCYLLSEESSFITGTTLNINGGRYM